VSSYSSVEKRVARFLSSFPLLKKVAKYIYSRAVYLVNKKGYSKLSDWPLLAFDVNSLEAFFGYYDKSPGNTSGLVIAHTTAHDTSVPPKSSYKIGITVFDSSGKQMMSIPSSAYNLQQGSRAHWLSDNCLVFNDYDESEGHYVSKVFSVGEGQLVEQYGHAVQDSFENKFFLSLNYRRLMALRPDYGYRNIPNMTEAELREVSDDGLWFVDYKTGESRLLVSIQKACELKPDVLFDKALHKFNHVMISPSGEKAIFMHRYIVAGRRFDRLLSLEIHTGEIELLSDYGMVSHCFWADDNTVLGYMRGPDGRDTYWLINVSTGEFKESPTVELKPYGDGHPHVHGDWFVTDTYPDKARMQHLLLGNWKTGEVRHLGEFFHAFRFSGESRCDLHPRFSPDGKSVYFDSVWSGKRCLYRLDLEN
jgi:hypothetical protein